MKFISTFEHKGITFVEDANGNYWRLVPVEPYTENLSKSTETISIKEKISGILLKLGLPQHLSGFEYLIEAVNLIYKNPSYCAGFTSIVYPTLAEMYNSNSSRVERAIRHIIQTHSVKTEFYTSILGEMGDKTPTNKAFVIALAQYIRTN